MEPTDDDPGPKIQSVTHTASISTKEVQAKRILETYATVFCAILRRDSRLTHTEELLVPETGSVPVQPQKRRWRLARKQTAPAPQAEVKRCWTIGPLFDVRADGPQALLVATDGTPYCSFARLGRGDTYVEVTQEFLLAQSGSILIFMIGTLEEKLSELLEQRDKSA